jgi:hypothetical protein
MVYLSLNLIILDPMLGLMVRQDRRVFYSNSGIEVCASEEENRYEKMFSMILAAGSVSYSYQFQAVFGMPPALITIDQLWRLAALRKPLYPISPTAAHHERPLQSVC